MDAETGPIVASTLTTKDVDDGSQVGPLLDKVMAPVASFTADCAYDQEGVAAAVAERHPDVAVIVPPRSTAVPSETAEGAPTQRDGDLRCISEHGRAALQKASGYNTRACVEAAIGRFKQVIGDGLCSRTDQRRVTEVEVAVHALNRMLELGRPISVRIAPTKTGSSLGSGAKPPDLTQADDGDAEGGEREVDAGAAVVAHGEAAEPGEPRQRPPDLPAVAPEPFTGVDPASGDPRDDAAGAALAAAPAVAVTLVGTQLVRAAARPARAPADRRNRVEGGCQTPAVVPVGAAERHAERRALAIDDDVPLRARLAVVRRVGPGLLAPPLARTAALPSEARLQSRRSAPRSRPGSTRCSARHTPAACHSASRRQQVLPPRPISAGTPRHWMPALGTKGMPAGATRSGTHGRPPFGFGDSDRRSLDRRPEIAGN